jgi:dienelactone hydrolase
MRFPGLAVAAFVFLTGHDGGVRAQQPAFRTHTTTYEAPRYTSADDWKTRAAYLREHVLASAGLLPMPERTPLHPVVFGELKHDDYLVSKVYFESLPGFLVTGNLYRPTGPGPFPAVLSPHGHWAYGRLENTPLVSAPGRAINLARQGFVVFTYDMIGYNDSRQLPHTFGGKRENLWGLSLAGLQLWNSIRSLDFLDSLPYVRRDAIGATGESGGGTQTFLLAAVDDRVAVAAPVNMISLHMQGGCLCENPPGLRLETTNVEIAASIAPRPLLMVSATGDWTADTLEKEFPAVRGLYALLGAGDRVHAVRVQAEHNYNRESREAMYAWMARWLQQAPADVQRPERAFTPDPLNDLLVFEGRALPADARSAADLTAQWMDAATHQLASVKPEMLGRALRHTLGFGNSPAPSAAPAPVQTPKTVLVAAPDEKLDQQLRKAGFVVQPIPFTPFDAQAAGEIRHFETYNRTAASQRVADVVAAIKAHPGAAVVANGDAALAALLATAVVPVRLAILDVGDFDTSSDTDYLEHLYVPGLRRAGGLQTAASAAGKTVLIHNAGERFGLTGVPVQRTRLDAVAIVAALRVRPKT